MFFEDPSIFVCFLYNDEALILRLHVVALQVSVIVATPAKIAQKLEM